MQVGIDIQDVERMNRFDREKCAKIFSEREIEYFDSKNWAGETVCGMFCAKEAFFKAVGTGVEMSRLHDVETLHDGNGAPYLHLSPYMIRKHNLNTAKIALNISHTKTVAVAVCVILKVDLLMG